MRKLILLLIIPFLLISCNDKEPNENYNEYIGRIDTETSDFEKLIPVSYNLESDGVAISDYFIMPDNLGAILITKTNEIWFYSFENSEKRNLTYDYPYQQDLEISVSGSVFIYVSNNDIIKTGINGGGAINLTNTPNIDEINPSLDNEGNLLYTKIEASGQNFKNYIIRKNLIDGTEEELFYSFVPSYQDLSYPIKIGVEGKIVFSRLQIGSGVYLYEEDKPLFQLFEGIVSPTKFSTSANGAKLMIKKNRDYYIINDEGVVYNDIAAHTNLGFDEAVIGTDGSYAILGSEGIVTKFITLNFGHEHVSRGENIKISYDNVYIINSNN